MNINANRRTAYTACSGAIVVAILAGWFSGSYSVPQQLKRYRELQELRIESAQLLRVIAEKKYRLAALNRGEVLWSDFHCTITSLRGPL